MILFYIILWAAVLYNFINYYFIIKKLQALSKKDSKSIKKFNKLLYYPMILIICFFWACFLGIYILIDDTKEWMLALHLFFAGLMGFLDSIVYGLTP